jgi:HK97 family phage portal protein
MSILSRLVERRSVDGAGASLSAAAIPPPGFFYPTESGKTVNSDSAMRLAAVWACVNLITDIAAPLPWHAYQLRSDGTERRIADHPLLTSPSNEPSLSAADWRAQVYRSMLLRGNAYGLVKEIGSFGEPTKIQILHPDYVSVVRLGQLGPYEFRVLGDKHELWQAGGDLWHLPAFTVPGSPVGLSPIDFGRQSIGLGLATESFGAQWFGDSAIPSGVLTTDQQLTGDQAQQVKQRWNESVQGGRGTAVLGAGIGYKQIQVSPQESQFLDAMKFNVQQVCRLYGVPPEMIGADSGNSMTYASVDSRMVGLLTLTGRPWLAKLEQALSSLLRSDVTVRASVDDLLRTDAKTRTDIQSQRLRMGVRSVDEIRAEDNLEPLSSGEGDRYLWPPYATGFIPESPDIQSPNDPALSDPFGESA